SEEKVFEFKRVAYDTDAAAQKIFCADLEQNFGNRLFLGVQRRVRRGSASSAPRRKTRGARCAAARRPAEMTPARAMWRSTVSTRSAERASRPPAAIRRWVIERGSGVIAARKAASLTSRAVAGLPNQWRAAAATPNTPGPSSTTLR